jgi:succinate dehydrogenase / fumarate reductase cytochrome b subunit
MAETRRVESRPLSPHLQIWRWHGTMLMSILHRITGVGLYFGTALVVWWLAAAAGSPAAFDFVSRIAGSWFGLLVLFGFTWALLHHALGGVRHFVWDLGYGFGRPARDALAWLTLAGSAALTLLVWAVVFLVR